MAHPPEVGGVGLKRGGDGAFEGDGAVGVEQLDESAGEDTEVVVAFGGSDEQRLGRGGGVVEAVGGAVLAGGALVAFELFDVGGVFDLLGAVERARMGGEHGGGVEDAHGLERGRDGEGAADVVVGDGIIVPIEPYVGALGGCDLDALLAGERIVGKRDEVGALFGEDVCDGALWVFGTGALGGAGVAPLIGLVIEVVEVAEAPRLEKASANKADEPLDSPFGLSCRLPLIRPGRTNVSGSRTPSTRSMVGSSRSFNARPAGVLNASITSMTRAVCGTCRRPGPALRPRMRS